MAVTPATIATALGVAAPDSSTAKFDQWSMWIADALMLINDRKASLEIETDLDATKLDYVVREAVSALARRPDDATQVSVSIDDGSVSKTFRSGTGRVSILDEWWALLGLTSLNGGAFAVDLLGTSTLHLPWCDLYFGALSCSCGVDIAGYPIFEQG